MPSIIDPSTSTIVKSDRIGRTRYSRQYKQQVLAALESSSLSAPSFAAQCGIKYPTFAAWITASTRSTPKRVGDSATFLIAEVAHAADGTSLEAHLPGGAVAKATDSNRVRLIAELLRHLS